MPPAATAATATATATASRSVSDADDASANTATSVKREFQRSFKACDGCRTKKVKCDLGSLDAPSEPPCSRCKREMRQCLFTMSTRGRGGSKSRSVRAHAFGAHHLAKSTSTPATHDDDRDYATDAIDALAGAALAALPDTNPRLHSTRNDVSVKELDPSDAPSIGMIYGIDAPKRDRRSRSGSQLYPQKRSRYSRPVETPDRRRSTSSRARLSESDNDGTDDDSDAPAAAQHQQPIDEGPPAPEIESDPLQQYASVGLQHSRDALRVLAGVAVESRDSTASHSTSPYHVRESPEQNISGESAPSPLPEDIVVETSNHLQPSPAASSSVRPSFERRSRIDAPTLMRPNTPPPLKHRYGWSKFEPIRLKLIKRSEAKYFLNFFIRRMHSFAPHCSPHLLDKSLEALSELVSREPILLGAMLSVASRYDVANHNAHLIHPDTFHRKISKWTQEKISRSFFLPGSHTIGTIEALLILSEWATLDLHDRRASEDASSESENDPDGDDRDFQDLDDTLAGDPASEVFVTPAGMTATPGTSTATVRPGTSSVQPSRLSGKGSQRPSRLDLRESEKFDDTAWMLTGTALRLAERLDLQNAATYSGISSTDPLSRRNAERRMRVWMSSVHADCHLSVRLGRRISSPGLMAPFMNLVRDRTHPFLIRSDASSSIGLSDTSLTTGSPRAWIAFRAHAELLQIVFRTCENLYRSRAVTERLLEDEDFVPALKSIRDDLDEWANWTQPRIEPIRDMASLRLRVEYHYARLYADGVALDSLKRGLGTFRPNNRVRYHSGGNRSQRDGGLMEIGLSTHPAYPFVREALAAAQSLIRILTVELDSMMCAPARWFLLLVMAAVFCVKATAVSDAILPLNRCAQSLQQVIAALTKAAPDGVHLANRYSIYLRQLAKQLVLTDAKSRRRSAAAASTSCAEDQRSPEGTRAGAGAGQRRSSGWTAAGWTGSQGETLPNSGQHRCSDQNCSDGACHHQRSRASVPGAQANVHHAGPDASPPPSMSPASQLQQPGASSYGIAKHAKSVSASGGRTRQTQTGGGTWWSTGDVLGGEMDPDSFLRWLDEQTLSTSNAGQSAAWPASSTHYDGAAGSFALQGASAYGQSVDAAGFGGATRSNSAGALNAGTLAPVEAASYGGAATNGTSTVGRQPTIHPGLAVTPSPGAEQDDLLTRMWLNDALTDLASSGLDMPFF
ncbi:zinc finger transcriptional activator [Thecaphora frezii]